MKINSYKPTELLRPFIKTYRIIESQGELVNRVVPSSSFAIAFRFRGYISYIKDDSKIILPTVTFSGLRKSVRLIHYAPNTSALIVLFNETGASAFFKEPLHNLFEESIPLSSIFPSLEILMMEERLAKIENNNSKIAAIEDFLISKLLRTKPDILISNALTKIHASSGTIRISKLADDLNISQDAFEKRFRKVVGATPKQFSSIVKISSIIRHNPPSSFLDQAIEHAYYDQSHFNKDFKLFTGQTPTDFFKSPSYW